MMPDAAPDLRFWALRRLPVILQTESGECGLACLAMVAGYWGHRIDLPTLRRKFSLSLKGTPLRGLISMGQSLSLKARPVKLEMEDFRGLRMPCVLHWDMNHFVVLRAISGNEAVIHDPSVGERRLSMKEVAGHFTGVALELTPSPEFRRRAEVITFTLRELMGRVVGLRRGLAQLIILGVSLQVCALVAPFYLQWTVDDALVAGDHDLITVLGLGFLLLVGVQVALTAFRTWITTSLATSLNFQWLSNVFDHLMRLPLPYFEKRHLGDIVSRFGSIQTIQRSLTTQFVEGVLDGVLSLTTLAVMIVYNLRLAAVACLAVIAYAITRYAMYRRLREATSEQIIHAARQQTHFMESARGIQSVRLFNRVEERRFGWTNALADQFNADLRIARLSVVNQTINNALFGAERVIVVWMAAKAVLDARFSVGMLFSFLSYKDQFSQRVAALIDKLFDWRMLRLHGERVADIVLTDVETEDAPSDPVPGKAEITIELRNVSFRYSDSEPWVLNAINLKIDAGECTAITGGSGCGKTTLLKLMLGLLAPTEGEILVAGVRLARFGISNYRDRIGTVMQDDHLFAGSIASNISFFDTEADQARIEHVATLAAIDREIAAMPMGYGTLIGDIGMGISGGQKQRILLARALYKQPRIIFLDEATSHLDVWNERLVNSAVGRLDLTRVIVAHRPETIASARRIIVLHEGRIIRDVESTAAVLSDRANPFNPPQSTELST